jgi:Cu-Zn family superoxide dismutase
MKVKQKFGVLFLATVAAAVVSLTLPAGADSGVVQASGPLRDLSVGTADPTDGASAQVTVAAIDGYGSKAFLTVTGLDPDWVGTTLGAHVHSGSCVAGQPTTAGPHYNTGGPADQDHEVWLDFRIRPGGVGFGRASVPFVIPHGGAHAVVIHAMATQPGGAAGPRWACLPVEF